MSRRTSIKSYWFIPMFPPNFMGDVEYATAVARVADRYQNPGYEVMATDLEDVVCQCQDKKGRRSCTTGDLIRDPDGKFFMVKDFNGFILLNLKTKLEESERLLVQDVQRLCNHEKHREGGFHFKTVQSLLNTIYRLVGQSKTF
jgi:hypothetical protein